MTRIATITLTLAVCLSPYAIAQDLFLTNARIVDPARQEVRRGTLLIVGGRIVGSPERAAADFTGEALDVGGKWIIPGLNDLHTHSYGNMGPGNALEAPGRAIIAKRMLYAGVTGFLDLFGNEDQLFSFRERQRAGQAGGADLYASLSCLTATDGHCTEYGTPTRVMDSPADARRVVADLAGRRPDVVKIVYAPSGQMPSIDKETLAAAVATATDHGIRTVIHVNTWEDVQHAVEVGASAVTHVPWRGPIPDDLAHLMADRDVASIPTLAVQTDMADFIDDASVLDHSLARALTTDDIIDAYRTDEIRHHRAEFRERARLQKAMVLSSVKTMADHGISILTGTDAGNWGTIQGYSLHRELMKLTEAGLTTWQALAASTTRAGEFLGRAFGVAPGDEANLVVLDASPIEDIRNTQRIVMVIHHGKVVDREGLLEK